MHLDVAVVADAGASDLDVAVVADASAADLDVAVVADAGAADLDVPGIPRAVAVNQNAVVVADPESRKVRERERIVEALEQCAWNKSKAARLLEMPRRTFYRRLTEYDIQ